MRRADKDGEDVVALFLDGKTFADATMVVALGITLSGENASWASWRQTRRTRKC